MESPSWLELVNFELSLELRRKDSLPVFKKSLFDVIFKEQRSLNHFSI